MPNNKLANPLICSYASFWIVSLTPFNNKSDSSRDLIICIFRVPGAGISRHANDIRKIYEGQSFYKGKGKWWDNYKINDFVVFNDFKGSHYQLSQRLKLLDCFPYVTESRGVYEIY